ncbi:PiggyBac transposable element-derived protein, partial [Trinorchestia longiramus]
DIYYVKWHDNRIVNIVSNFARASPVTTIERFDSKQKKVVEVPCPDIIQRYNKSMGGVDLADSLIAL